MGQSGGHLASNLLCDVLAQLLPIPDPQLSRGEGEFSARWVLSFIPFSVSDAGHIERECSEIPLERELWEQPFLH